MIDTFITKPFGMEWKVTKSDKNNLYVSKVQPISQAALGNVTIGSKLISLNGEMIEDMGANNIYGKLAVSVTITFLKPFKKDIPPNTVQPQKAIGNNADDKGMTISSIFSHRFCNNNY